MLETWIESLDCDDGDLGLNHSEINSDVMNGIQLTSRTSDISFFFLTLVCEQIYYITLDDVIQISWFVAEGSMLDNS